MPVVLGPSLPLGGGFQINGLAVVDTTISSYSPLPMPSSGITTSVHASEGAQEKAFARTVNRPLESWKGWIIQANRALARSVAQQLLELARNTDIQPCYVQMQGGSPVTELDGWYHVAEVRGLDYRNDFTGTIPFEVVLRREGARGRNRLISWRDASMTVAQASTTALGLPVEAVAPTPNISRAGAEGAVVVATGLPANGLIQVAANTPDFTRRVRIFDRNTGAAASTLSGANISLSGWQEVFAPDHYFVSDLILTNGLVMVEFAVGSLPKVYRYQNAAWTVNEQITWQPTGGGTNQTIQAVTPLSFGWEKGVVQCQLAANGYQSRLTFRLDRGMLHVDVVGVSFTSGGQLVYVSPKNLKLALGDTGLSDITKADAALATSANSLIVLSSTDATMTWLASIGLINQAGLGSMTTTSALLPAVARGASQRAMFAASYQSGGTVFLQKEAESATLVGAGATSVADAAASGGNAVQMAGTEVLEGVSFVPGSDGMGVPTGMTYGITARVRVDATGAQVCRLVNNAGTPSMTLVTSTSYGVQTAVNSAAVTAATGQTCFALRARYIPIILNDNAVRYYRLNDTNATMVDSSVNASNGTYTASPTQSQAGALTAGGDNDNAVLFNGTTQYATPTEPAITGNASWTMEVWIKTSANPTDQFAVSLSDNTGARTCAHLGLHSGGVITFSDGAVATNGAAALNNGVYHHIAATYDGTIVRTYADGQPSVTYTPAGGLNLTGTNSRIGARSVSGATNAWFSGTLDEVAFYAATLSANQILAHYNAGKALGKLLIDEVGIIPYANAGNGPLDIWQSWSADKDVRHPVLV